MPDKTERWRQLAARIVSEKDPQKLTELMAEMDRIMNEESDGSKSNEVIRINDLVTLRGQPGIYRVVTVISPKVVFMKVFDLSKGEAVGASILSRTDVLDVYRKAWE